MRLTILGCGDAFGSGGRFNACFLIESGARRVLLDCGASSLVAMRVRGVDPNRLEGVILSHLHGDHFGGLPFLLLDAQHASQRREPLTVAGPPGTRARFEGLMEAMFPRSWSTRWRFPLEVVEIPLASPTEVLGFTVTTAEVVHYSGTPSTAVRLTDGEKTLAYSGDTEWTDALLPIAEGADLFIMECYDYARALTGHMSWEILKSRRLAARRVMVTHMNAGMLAHVEEAKAAGFLVAEDGASVSL
ncbi:MAG: MBL fold metallo-hydrolase [Xanthobacteraceae bacterium]|nr:MBL fold metallo-hydrolase [Xanthobacteraceae bacterium]